MEKVDTRRSQQISNQTRPEGPGICGLILTLLSYVLVLITFPVSLCLCIKVVQEYERAVIFRLGRLLPGGAVGPGIFFVLPCIDSYRKVDMRTVSFDVPPQEILSKDSVTVAVDAVVYYRVSNATISVTNVEDAARSTRLLAATTLRNVLGTKTLGEVLAERESISHLMQSMLDDATHPWGVKVERVEMKDVRLPVILQRAMAAEAEAAREANARVIHAEGEWKAATPLKLAADTLASSPISLQLQYLHTLNITSAEKNSTIIFPVPMDFKPLLESSLAPHLKSILRADQIEKQARGGWVRVLPPGPPRLPPTAPKPPPLDDVPPLDLLGQIPELPSPILDIPEPGISLDGILPPPKQLLAKVLPKVIDEINNGEVVEEGRSESHSEKVRLLEDDGRDDNSHATPKTTI